MQLPKIDVQPLKLAQLLNDMKTGQLQVPRFQRDFVWSVTRTRRLLDSMYKEYPIGTFFLWRAPANRPLLFRPLPKLGIPTPSNSTKVSYILDGQQRLTSLFVTIEGIRLDSRDYRRICVDLQSATLYDQSPISDYEDDIFVYRAGDNNRYISVHDLVSPEHLMIFSKIPQEWQQAFNKAHNLFHTYPFSVVWIEEQGLDDAIEIFQRINQSGKKLSRYDLICANLWTEKFDFRKRIEDINEKFEREGFGRLPEAVFTQTFALALKNNCTTEAEFSLKTEEIVENWDEVIKAMRVGIGFLINNLGVKRAQYLPYRGIVPVLAHYFYNTPDRAISANERANLWNWFWRVTLSERYSASTTPKMAEDARKLQALRNGEQIDFNYPLNVTAEAISRVKMTQTTSALRNATVCMLVLKQPRNLKDGSQIDVADITDDFFSTLGRSERHRIFSDGYLKEKGKGSQEVQLIPNFCFIPAMLNKEIGNLPPSQYLRSYQEENPDFQLAASSNLLPIDADSPVWQDDFEEFIKVRSQVIADELRRMVEVKPSEMIDVSEPKVETGIGYRVDLIEMRLRDFIDHRLTAVVGAHYWKSAMPGDVINSVKEIINDQLERNPNLDWSYFAEPRKRLDFCDVSHYEKILLKNWAQFEEFFKRKDELQRHFSAYRILRNCIQHNRQPTEIEEKNGDASMLWLTSILDRYDSEFVDIEDKENGDEQLEEE